MNNIESNNLPSMTFKRNGKVHNPLFVAQVNGRFIVGVYQGTLSKYDILIKYRQKEKGKWSNIRTPKHIHWAVDILIKMHADRENTKRFLDFLIQMWAKIKPMKSDEERRKIFESC